jgi:AAA15 family ATPase/GTPase
MTKHLESLHIKNFRMLEDFSVERLGQVNLIVGKNNSGKSTVLDALTLYASSCHREVVDDLFRARNGGENNRSSRDQDFMKYSSLFYNNKIFEKRNISIGDNNNVLEIKLLYICRYEVKDEGSDEVSRRLKFFYNNEDFENGNYDEVMSGVSIEFNNEVVSRISDDIRLSRFDGRKNDLFWAYVDTQLYSWELLYDTWSKIVLTEHELHFKNVIRDIFTEVEDLSFLVDSVQDSEGFGLRSSRRYQNIRAIAKIKGVDAPVPLSRFGEGLRRIIQVVLHIYSAKDGFLLIDEFENGLHYSVQEKIWHVIFEMAQRLNIQVFATTHSRDCIEAFTKVANDRADVEGLLFRMGRSAKASDEGKIIATIFDEAKLQRFSDMDMDVR